MTANIIDRDRAMASLSSSQYVISSDTLISIVVKEMQNVY